MEKIKQRSGEYRPVSEKETMDKAQEVLGAIPRWYWENKEKIENYRNEFFEETGEILADIGNNLKKMGRTLH